jgi:hypothetical protein
MKNAKKVRINIEVKKEKLDEIKKLMEIAGVNTQKELFDNALTLTKWMMRQKKAGKSVGALNDDDDRFTELDMPILENAKESNLDF